jgi:Cys-rich repeat protein
MPLIDKDTATTSNASLRLPAFVHAAIVLMALAAFAASPAFAGPSHCDDDLVGDFDSGCESGEICGAVSEACLPEGSGEEDGEHVTLCHRPPGCPGNTRTITVGQCAVASHLAHGDTLGACPECSNDDDCPGHGVCNPSSGVCQDPDGPCVEDSDCGGGQVCNSDTGTCQDPGGPCADDTDCGGGQVCNSDTGTCQDPGGPCTDDSDCAGGQACNTDSGTCQDPNGPCSTDSECAGIQVCNPQTNTCQDPTDECATDADCDDGAFCNGSETCHAAMGCVAGTNPCDDAIACTVDGCDENADSCTYSPSDANCDDGLYCNGEETCDPQAGCTSGDPVDCSYMASMCGDGFCDENMRGCWMDTKNEGASCAVAQNACVVDNICSDGACLAVPFCNTQCERCDLDSEGVSWCASLCGNPHGRENDDVSITDALYNLRASVDLEECNLCICDVNGDGKMTVVDTLLMMRFLVGLEAGFVCPETAY